VLIGAAACDFEFDIPLDLDEAVFKGLQIQRKRSNGLANFDASLECSFEYFTIPLEVVLYTRAYRQRRWTSYARPPRVVSRHVQIPASEHLCPNNSSGTVQ
jgi:hypothetical protein